LATASFDTYSQFNDSTHYYLRYGATGIINNTDDGRSYLLNNAITFNIHKKKVAMNSSSAWIYGRQDDALTNNDFSTGLNFDVLKELQRFYYWGLANFTTSYSLKINYQFQTGVGIGYNLSNKKDLEIVISDGILYEASDLESDVTGRDIYTTLRNSLRLKHRWIINKVVVFEGSHFWQPSLFKFNDYIIRSAATLSVRLKKWLSVTTAVNYNKLSRTQRENLLINFGLTAERYF
jgi:hypothetical protein